MSYVQDPSYFVNGMCGDNTTYLCPSAQQAIGVRGASAHIGPNGTAVIPKGTAVQKLRIAPFATEEK